MKLSQHKISEDKWFQLDKKYQLQSIAAELARISSGSLRYGNTDKITQGAYCRFFDLIDLAVCDPKWKEGVCELLAIRDAVASLYVGEEDPAAVTRGLYSLMMLERGT